VAVVLASSAQLGVCIMRCKCTQYMAACHLWDRQECTNHLKSSFDVDGKPYVTFDEKQSLKRPQLCMYNTIAAVCWRTSDACSVTGANTKLQSMHAQYAVQMSDTTSCSTHLSSSFRGDSCHAVHDVLQMISRKLVKALDC